MTEAESLSSAEAAIQTVKAPLQLSELNLSFTEIKGGTAGQV